MKEWDLETIEGDYAEAFQRWKHHFDQAPDKSEECFKDSAFVPFVSRYEPLEDYNSRYEKMMKQTMKFFRMDND